MTSIYHEQWVAAKREIYQLRGMLEESLVQEHRLDPWTVRKFYAQSQEEGRNRKIRVVSARKNISITKTQTIEAIVRSLL